MMMAASLMISRDYRSNLRCPEKSSTDTANCRALADQLDHRHANDVLTKIKNQVLAEILFVYNPAP